jgi:hypothetical protein
MKETYLLFFLAIFSLPAWCSSPAPAGPDTPFAASVWPGIEMHVEEIDRIAGNRLLVVIRLWASPKAPPSTQIGLPPIIPPDEDKRKLPLIPRPFSLHGSTMIEDLTQQKYDMLPVSQTGPIYRSSAILSSLSSGQSIYLTIQFAVPPPPPVPPGALGRPPKQTVTFWLTNAKGPITHVPLPPLESAPKPKN